jgi:hypothetical protein
MEGDAVWPTANGYWSSDIQDAEFITDEGIANLRMLDGNAVAII